MSLATSTHKDSIRILEQKIASKTALQESLGWPCEAKRMMLCVPTGMSNKLGGLLFESVLEGLLSLPVEILLLAKGTKEYEKLYTSLVAENNHRIAMIDDTAEQRGHLYHAADSSLFFADPSALPELQYCLQSGAVPIAPTCDILQDYNPNQEQGTAFLYDKLEPWHSFRAIVRALETYRFPYDWKTIQKQCTKAAKI